MGANASAANLALIPDVLLLNSHHARCFFISGVPPRGMIATAVDDAVV
jgi:hypothetical protein